MTGRRRRTEDAVGMQITPMIDMTFLLLIFFMVTSKLSKEQIKMDVELPVASAAVLPDDLSNRDIINIDGEGVFYVADAPVGEAELRAYLGRRLASHPPLKIYLRADATTPAKTIKRFMEMAAEAGAIEVIFGSLTR